MAIPYSSEEARLHAVVNTAVHGVILIDSAGIVLMFNPACERLFGYRADEVIGKNVKMLMPSPYREGHDDYIGNYLKSGKAKVIGIGREVVAQRKDGSTFPMDLQIGEAKHEDTVAFVGIIHDLTERKRVERSLQESAARLKAVVDTAVDGVILIDMQGIVLMFNPACERLFGYRADEIIGKNVKMLMPPPYRDEHDRYVSNYVHTGERKIIGIGREVTGQRKDGSTFPMDLSVGEAKQEGGSIFVGMIHDLSSRKRTEEQLAQAQKMEAVGQLSGGLAHDFNNLLTVVVGNAETLSLALKARPDLKQAADMIATAGERGAELTRRLLAFSRRQMLQPAEINCNRLIDSMQRMLWRTLREDIEIRIALAPDLWPAFADGGQLETAILNLAINARDAMPAGGSLTISTANVAVDEHYRDRYPEVTPGNYVLIAVTDTGDGMTPEVLARAFEPFFTTKEVGKGSGLGLSMVYGFMKQSNGHVSIYSEVNLGTTVRLYLPAHSTLPADVTVASTAAEGEPPRGRETVLVTEDDPFVRAYVVGSLEDLGYRVIAAQDAREALTHLTQTGDIDLLFTDIVMPGGLNGWELAERAQQIKPSLKLLFTSGYALETLVARGRIHPDTAILNKPYRRPELARRLRETLDAPQVVAAPPMGK
ncbi:MAG TPA: PAS domain S-box protein [Candidatus Acidoferrum sp.]|nr:PAS domain S-box protein [Candidatus Acidoferrum sp.]